MYIKICPACGHKNAESEYVCQGNTCNKHFLGDVEPVLDSGASDASGNPSHYQEEQSFGMDESTSYENVQEEEPSNQGNRKTNRFTSQPMLSVEYAGHVYDVESGNVMGKADVESDADVQIPGLPGYIHRRYCQFDFVNGQWQVTAIENTEFTNPTYVNAVKVLPNQSKQLKNGDRLTLCDITFQVRITP